LSAIGPEDAGANTFCFDLSDFLVPLARRASLGQREHDSNSNAANDATEKVITALMGAHSNNAP
jgi:hypothetical protein